MTRVAPLAAAGIAAALAAACEPEPVAVAPSASDVPRDQRQRAAKPRTRRSIGPWERRAAPGEAAATAPAAEPEPASAGPAGPDPAEANRIWDQQAVPAFQRCFEAEPAAAPPAARVDVRFRIYPDGRVIQPEIVGGDAQPAVGRCIRSTLDRLRFPSFAGTTQELQRSIEYRRGP